MNQPASLPSDRVAGIPWNGWPTCSGLGGRNRLDYVADFTGMRTKRQPKPFRQVDPPLTHTARRPTLPEDRSSLAEIHYIKL
jgi:hypothetical protein